MAFADTQSTDRNDNWMSLTAATRVAPGRPSVSCIWRWCRKGVLARSGERVRLQHVRVGGKVLTRAEWIESFMMQLAAADTRYFDAKLEAGKRLAKRREPRHRARAGTNRATSSNSEAVGLELDKEGL